MPKGGGSYKVGEPYRVGGEWFYPKENERYDHVGTASWYGELFHGRYTANGEIYDMDRLTAAHPTLPMPTLARVTNLSNGRTIVVRINDRGPYARGREIDLSRRSALALGFMRQGTASVRVTYLGKAPLSGDDSYERRVLASQGLSQYARGPSNDNVKTASLSSRDSIRTAAPPEPKPPADREDRAVTTVRKTGTPRVQVASASSRTMADVNPVGSLKRKTIVAADAAPPRAQSSQAGGIVIQAGSFKSRENAERAKRDLSSVAGVQIDSVDVGGEPFYRVRLGPFRDRAAAESALSRVKDAGHAGARVVSLEPARG